MDIEKKDRPGIAILQLSGKFDLEQAEAFQKQFAMHTEDKPKAIGLDMNNVQFIDSSGLGALIKVLNNSKNNGSDLVLFGLNQMIMNVFKLAKLDNFFNLMSNEDFNRKYPEDDD